MRQSKKEMQKQESKICETLQKLIDVRSYKYCCYYHYIFYYESVMLCQVLLPCQFVQQFTLEITTVREEIFADFFSRSRTHSRTRVLHLCYNYGIYFLILINIGDKSRKYLPLKFLSSNISSLKVIMSKGRFSLSKNE